MTSTKDPRSEAERRMNAIERDHFGQCHWQAYDASGRILVECLDYPKGNGTVIVVKNFDAKVPGARKWPKMTGCNVYLAATDYRDGSWDGLEAALALHEERLTKPKD